MGALIAVINKENKDATETAVTMLKAFKHKIIETYGIASPKLIKREKSVEQLQDQKLNSPVIIGHAFSKIIASDKPQPIKLENATIVFEGRIYSADTRFFDVEFTAEKLEQKRKEDVKALIKKFDGSFAFAIAESDKLIVGRDPLGIHPLYYGKNAELAALASERKALWKIGIRETCSFPPGHIAFVTRQCFKIEPVKKLDYSTGKRLNMQTAAKELQRLLLMSVKEKILRLKEVAVAFSGGLDSSITAFLAKRFGVDAHLIFVSLENQAEIEHAKKAAESLKLPIQVQIFKEKNVEEVLPRVLWLIEEPDPIKTSIGIPIYWTAEKASDLGFRVMLAGQGADELFGGYKRYLSNCLRYSEGELRRIMSNDVIHMYEKNFERDSKICSFHNVELRLPFASYPIAKFAISLSPKLKIKSSKDYLRKHVLRQAAENLGLPHVIANKPKKAIQYATGVNKTLKKLAKKEKLTVRRFLQKIFQMCSEKEIIFQPKEE